MAGLADRERNGDVRVLVAGANATLRELCSMLPVARYECVPVEGLEEAREALEAGGFDVCLLPADREDAGGLQLLRESHPPSVGTSVVAWSERDDSELDEEAWRCGASAFMALERADVRRLERILRYAAADARTLAEAQSTGAHLGDLLAHAPLSYLLLDREGRLQQASARGKHALERWSERAFATGEVVAPHLGSRRERFERFFVRALQGETVRTEARVHWGDDEEPSWLEVHYTPLRNPRTDEISGVCVSWTDIEERKLAEQRLAQEAHRDALTGLASRSFFFDRLVRALDEHHGSGGGVVVLFVDLDRFKVINESLGHVRGDELLAEMGRRVSELTRRGDCVARIGADEFLVLLDGRESVEEAEAFARSLQRALASPFELRGHRIYVSASMGISFTRGEDTTPDTMMRNADMAVHRAKERGGERYEIFDEVMHERATEQLRLENDLRHALEQDQFELFYQPIIDLWTGEIAGFEALIRWRHPERGMISPGRFMPIVEQTGLILPVSRWVARQACEQMRAWTDAYPDLLPEAHMSVNIPGAQFAQPDFVDELVAILEESGLEPWRLRIEITEGVAMGDPEGGIDAMRRLRDLGVHVSIDDFGTGYSSLGYLHRLPSENLNLKIDRTFVHADEGDVANLDLIRNILSLARHLRMDVVAEGIETAEQLATLRRYACAYGQGYYFARPMPAHEAEQLIASDPRW